MKNLMTYRDIACHVRILVMSMLAVLFLMPVQAQNIGDAFYIYRNDGDFHAFYRDEVDSIAYSHYDADSLYYDQMVTQVVYTADSIYKIPLAVIDSVAFVTPETKYKSEVVRLDSYLPSLLSANGMTLTFDEQLNGQNTLRVGDILLYENFTEQFPTGFAGRITNRTLANGEITFVCDSVCVEDIYDHILCYGSYTTVDDPESDGKGIKLIPSRKTSGDGTISTAIGINATVGAKGASLYASAEGKIGLNVRVTFKFNTGEKAFLDLSLSPELRLALEAGAKGTLGNNNALGKKIPLLAIPIPDTPFLLQYKGGPIVRPKLEASLTAKTEVTLGYRLGLKYENEKFRSYGSNTNKSISAPDIEGYVSGSLFVGLSSEVGIYMYGEILSLCLEKEAGVEFDANITANIFNSDIYQELQKAKFDVNVKGSANIKAEAKLFKIFEVASRFNLLNVKYNMFSYKLVPSFQKPVVSINGSSADIFVEPKEDLIFPVTVGLGVWDRDGVFKNSKFSSSNYRLKKNWPSGEFKTSFTGLTPYQTYTVRPLVKLFGGTIIASPEETFILKVMPLTLDAYNITSTSAKVYGKIDGYELLSDNVSYGIGYTTMDEMGQTLFDAMENYGSGVFSVNLISLKPNTTYYYFAYLIVDGEVIKGETKSFTTGLLSCPDNNHPHAIDLGLPSGTKWACCNVGAASPEGYGGYYAWGETSEKRVCNEYTYKFYNVYTDVLVNIGSNIAGTSHDAATANWGAPWRMPTLEQCRELINNTTSIWTTQNGVKGRKFTGSNGCFIFLPAAGEHYGSEFNAIGSVGCYWTSSKHRLGNSYQMEISAMWSVPYIETSAAYQGCSVRPVFKN